MNATVVPHPRRHKLAQRLSPELTAQIIADYKAGVSSEVLTEKYGLGKGPVLRLLHEHGVVMRRKAVRGDQVEAAVRLYAAGWSCARIAEQLGRHPSTVWKMLIRTEIQLRNPHERPQQ